MELEYRHNTYLQNDKYINMMNERNLGYKLKHNKYNLFCYSSYILYHIQYMK